MINEKLKARFLELEKELGDMLVERSDYSSCIANDVWQKWATSAEALIGTVCRQHSPYYKNFTRVREKCDGERFYIKSLAGIFRSAKEAFDGDYLFDLEREFSAEVFGSFIVLAKQALTEDNKDVAAVLASAALEDALKRHAVSNGLDVDDAKMAKVINALKSKGFISGAQKPMLDAMLQMRNRAMHAKWEKIQKPEVSSLVAFVEQFLLTHFDRRH